jgi:hypothetical protein
MPFNDMCSRNVVVYSGFKRAKGGCKEDVLNKEHTFPLFWTES